MSQLHLHVAVNRDDLLDALAELDQDDQIKLITSLDERAADWDFTRKLFQHFSKEAGKFLDESAASNVQDLVEHKDADRLLDVVEALVPLLTPGHRVKLNELMKFCHGCGDLNTRCPCLKDD